MPRRAKSDLDWPRAIPGDAESDGDVDLLDFSRYVDCVTAPGRAEPGADCDALAIDDDADIDMADFAILQTVFTRS